MSVPTFEVDDRVEYTYPGPFKGAVGTVTAVVNAPGKGTMYAIRWDGTDSPNAAGYFATVLRKV